jgi:apolipoprotein N-acyltransferase
MSAPTELVTSRASTSAGNSPKQTVIRIIAGLALAALGGGAFVLAFPPYGIWPLALVGWVPVLIAQYRIMPPKWSSLASAMGVYVWLQGYLGPVFAPVGTFMVWLPFVAALLSLLTDGGLRAFHEKTDYRWFVHSGIANWAGVEMIRLFLPIAGTWAFIAYPFYRQPWAIQPVSVFGIIGMGMLIMLINHALALTALVFIDTRSKHTSGLISPKNLRRIQIITAALTILWIVLSLVLYMIPSNAPSVAVAAVQPEVSAIVSANAGQNALVEKLHARMIQQTREAAKQGARVVVWPEGSLSWDPQIDDRLGLRTLAIETNVYLAVGYVVVEDGVVGFRNEATVIDPQGNFLGVFGKDHPVTFGGETSLSRGTYPVYDTAIGKLGTIICYDLDYTDTTRKLARQGVQLVGVPSNDWGSIADKHYAHVVFRAVENSVAMVKADGGFNSAIIDPKGHILALAAFPEGGEATLVSAVQIGSGNGTITTVLGDWMGWLSLAGMVFFTFGTGWLKKRAARTKEQTNLMD